MENKTTPVAVIFDFDETLCPDSTNSFLKKQGINVELFWKETNTLVSDGFDPVSAYMFLMKKYSENSEGYLLTREAMEDHGKTLSFFPGLPSFFNQFREKISTLHPNVNLSFFVISSGLESILKTSDVAPYFEGIFSSAFQFTDDSGKIEWPKRMVSFTDKTRFLFAVSKGLFSDPFFLKNPFQVNERFEGEDYHFPFRNMVYIGDGFTDVPCFSLLNRYEGYSVAVFKKEAPRGAISLLKDKRVKVIADVNYEENSPLWRALEIRVGEIAVSFG